MLYIIYKVTNKLNGKIYIGKHQTQDINDGYMGSGKHIRNAIDKHGLENFTKEILFQFDNEADMNAKEAELVNEEFVKEDTNYNLCPGGNGGWGYINSLENSKENKIKGGKAHSSEHMKMLGVKGRNKRNKRLEKDIEFRYYIADVTLGTGFLGMKHTDETKKKIGMKNSKNQYGVKNSQYGKKWIYSDNEKKSMRIDKDSDVPVGWVLGRKMKFD